MIKKDVLLPGRSTLNNRASAVEAFESGMPNKFRFATRMWYYFRIGYATYLTFLLGAVNTLVVVWYLAIKDIPAIETIFGHFVPFAIVTTLIGVPLSIGFGWAHYKRSPAYTSELDISVESNPYNYRLIPGKEKEVFAPMYFEMLSLLRRLLQAQNLMNSEEESKIEDLERRLRNLLDGGYEGKPRVRMQA